ncbi:MAG: hypothetical protein IT453_14050 [Planctomycetes bacterium]|nr:hypothetical protein [Planctomycetota bacterium]
MLIFTRDPSGLAPAIPTEGTQQTSDTARPPTSLAPVVAPSDTELAHSTIQLVRDAAAGPIVEPQRQPVSAGTSGSPESWTIQYERAEVQQLVEESKALDTYIVEQTKEEFDRWFAAGASERVSDGNKYDAADWDRTQLMQVRIASDGGVTKVVLPPDQFPDLYMLRQKQTWLADEAARRSNLIALGTQKK